MIKYFVIHCNEHIERLNNILDIKKTINQKITVFKGYYTKNINTNYTSKLNYLQKHDKNLCMNQNVLTKSGEIGCYLSHHMLIKDILDNSNSDEYSVILEDDIRCKETLHGEIQQIIKNMEKIDWDIIFLGNLTKNHGKQVIDNIYYINEKQICTGTHSLLINNKNVKKIYDTNCNILHAIDWQYKINIDLKNLNGYVIFQPICFQNKIFISNIQ
jgi:GR25 family glycosyltransferase involved in LPS biosynthesis